MGSNAGAWCVARHARRIVINSSTVSPIDLCRLKALTRCPTGSLGICTIHQPKAICATTARAISQCSTIAIVVYRSDRSEPGIRGNPDQKIAFRRWLEVAAAGIADDDGAGIIAPGKIIEAGEFGKGPLPCALLKSDAEIADRVRRRIVRVAVIDENLVGILSLECGRESIPIRTRPSNLGVGAGA